MTYVLRYFIFNTGENAKFTLNSHIMCVGKLNYLACKFYIFLKREMRTIDHN